MAMLEWLVRYRDVNAMCLFIAGFCKLCHASLNWPFLY